MQPLLKTDSELVELYLSGDESALEILVNQSKTKVYRYIRMVVKDRAVADDIFQETFIKVINTLRLGQYNEEGKFLPWVIRIAHNLMIDFFRKKKRIPEIKEKDDYDIFARVPDVQESFEDMMVQSQVKSEVWSLLNYLPAEQKEVVWMRCHCCMSFKEIAEETGTSINTSLGRMRYALINLRKLIKENGIAVYA
ncbi:MAG: sigma-70 family RNA polymerase sigma factor [Bacteroidetes bacterium]|nr:sigma-70 family RNA polymerase sigma factor [Bacteroidota bacterium]